MQIAITSSRQMSPLILAVVFGFIATVAVILRVVARRIKKTALNGSDYCIFVALVLMWGLCSCDVIGVVEGGVGIHALDLMQSPGGPLILVKFLKTLVAIQILWAVSLMFIKVSILLFYVSIFDVPMFKTLAKMALVLVVLWCSSVILCAFLLCRPFAFNWDQTIPGGSCGNQIMSYVITGAFNIVTDFVVLCLPIPYVWKLKTNQSNKIALTGIFGVGFLVCIISIVRLVTLVNVSYQDITYSVVDALIWSMLEPTLGVTLACVPLMRPLFSKIFPDPTARSKKPSKGYGSSGNSGGHRSKPTKDFDSDEFHKIDSREADQYPMHGIGDPEATGSRDDMIHKNNSVVSLPTAAPQRSGRDSQPTVINVKKEWRVESQR